MYAWSKCRTILHSFGDREQFRMDIFTGIATVLIITILILSFCGTVLIMLQFIDRNAAYIGRRYDDCKLSSSFYSKRSFESYCPAVFPTCYMEHLRILLHRLVDNLPGILCKLHNVHPQVSYYASMPRFLSSFLL